MSKYLLRLMKEDADRKIAALPSSAVVRTLLTQARSAPVRQVLTAAEAVDLEAHIIGMALAFYAIGEDQAITAMQSIRRRKPGTRKKSAQKRKRS